jgi:hypothetical protein
VLFDETTSTLFCGDLFAQTGDGPALVHEADIVGAAMEAEDLFHATCLTLGTAAAIAGLADLAPRTLALMHGPTYAGDCVATLRELAGGYAERVGASFREAVAR